LVHDDLPAMDNDDWRRGMPSCHRAFDEATAILTGNALHHLAISHLIDILPTTIGPEKTLDIMAQIFHHIGTRGILSGQSMDLSLLSQHNLDQNTLTRIHHLKTTALLQAIVESTWIAGNGSLSEHETLVQFTQHLGLAYQMLDDYGDKYATQEWGKNQASDAINQKLTFVDFYSQEALKQEIQNEFMQAQRTIEDLADHQPLLSLLYEIEERLKNI
jgi:farnesyl diphosphate synthase